MEAVVQRPQNIQDPAVPLGFAVILQKAGGLVFQPVLSQKQVQGKDDGQQCRYHTGEDGGDGLDDSTHDAAQSVCQSLQKFADPGFPVDGFQNADDVLRQDAPAFHIFQQQIHGRRYLVHQQHDTVDQLRQNQTDDKTYDQQQGHNGGTERDDTAGFYDNRLAGTGEIMPLEPAHQDSNHIGNAAADQQRNRSTQYGTGRSCHRRPEFNSQIQKKDHTGNLEKLFHFQFHLCYSGIVCQFIEYRYSIPHFPYFYNHMKKYKLLQKSITT